MSELSLSVVMPVYQEGDAIVGRLEEVCRALPQDAELLVVFDMETDSTVPFLEEYARKEPRLRPLLNTYGRGPAPALRYGLDQARSEVAVVVMADGSDDPEQIVTLAQLVRDGAAVAAASRYMRGGRQEGGPIIKRSMSRMAGLTLHWFARVPIHDPTSAFKAYRVGFVRDVGIDSREGFEISLELVAKAHRLRLPMSEIPTVWRDRTEGESHFRLMKWLPSYLRWYRFAFGRRLSVEGLRARTEAKNG